MPRLAANVSLLFTEMPFLERFAAARRAGFRYVDTVPSALDDHRICDGPRTHIAVNFLRLNGVTGPFEDRIDPKNWLHNNLHPKDRKSTRLNSSHIPLSRMPSSA